MGGKEARKARLQRLGGDACIGRGGGGRKAKAARDEPPHPSQNPVRSSQYVLGRAGAVQCSAGDLEAIPRRFASSLEHEMQARAMSRGISFGIKERK